MRDTHSHTHLEAPTEAEKPYTHACTHWKGPTTRFSWRRIWYIAAVVIMACLTLSTCDDPCYANIPAQASYVPDQLQTTAEQQQFVVRCASIGGELVMTDDSYVCILHGNDED